MRYTRIAEVKRANGAVYTADYTDIIENWVYNRSAMLLVRYVNKRKQELYGFPKRMNIEIALKKFGYSEVPDIKEKLIDQGDLKWLLIIE